MKATCNACGKPFEAQRKTAKFCGATCRKRASRSSGSPVRVVSDAPAEPDAPAAPVAPLREPPLVAATRKELEAAERLDTYLGQQAMGLAWRLSGPSVDTGSAVAALSKELRAVMAEALKGVGKAADSLDELAERRARKAAGA